MTTDVTLSSQINQAQRTTNSAVTLAEDFTQFLQILTTQLQNQDPLSPLDSNEFTSQLVQFSQVEQAINSNSKLDNLVNLQLNSAATSALGYVGLDASYVSAEIALEQGSPANIRYSLSDPATVSQINIFSEDGQLVQSVPAERGAGVHNFEWDGTDLVGNPVDTGTYVVRVDAADASENPVATTTVVTGRVKGIEQQDGIVYALIGERAVPITSILNAVTPPEDNTTDNGGANGGST